MAWIEPADIVAVFPTDASTEGLIAHVQALAEVVIGEQTEPVTSQLAAVMVQITHRFYLATDADGNIVQETLGPHSYTRSSTSGFGLTNAERALLKQAIGESVLWVQPFTRGPLETANTPFAPVDPAAFETDPS